MPRTQRSELVAGVFVIVSLGVALGVVLWLGAADVFRPARQRVYFYLEEGQPGANLMVGSFLQIAGANVGKITEIGFDAESGRTHYIAEIEHPHVLIHSDATARVQAGLLGVAALAVTRGSSDKPLADRQNPVAIEGGFDQAVSDLAAAAAVVRKELDVTRPDAVLSQLKSILASLAAASDTIQETVARISGEMSPQESGSLLAMLRRSAADVAEAAAGLRREISLDQEGSLVSRARGILQDLQEVTADAKPRLKNAVANLEQTTGRVSEYSRKDLAEILASLRQANTEILKAAKVFAEVGEQAKEVVLVNRQNIDEIVDNLAIVSANFKSTSKEVRRNPWRLLHKPSPEELKQQNLYDAAGAFLSGAEQLDQALSKLSGLAKAYPEGIDPKDPRFQEIRRQVLETFEQFKKAEESLWKEMK